MPPTTRATGLDTPASNMESNEHEHEHEQEHGLETPTPMLRGGQLGSGMEDQMDNNSMMRMMMEYMRKRDEQMEMLIQKLAGNSTSLSTPDPVKDKIDEFRKDSKTKLEGKHAVILNGSNNYQEWKSSILADAHLIQAKNVLVKEETVPPTTVPLDIEIWKKKNELLYTRIFQSLTATKDLAQRYAISRAEERLITTKKLRELHLRNGDFLTYMATFRDLKAKLVSLGENWAESTYHDFFILGLGNWQQEFMRMKLDEFYATKQGPIRNLNLDDLMDQLAARATTTATTTATATTAATKYCWFKHPSLASADWKERNKGRIKGLKDMKDMKDTTDMKEGSGEKEKENILATQPAYAVTSHKIDELLKNQPHYTETG
ncbi:hypothetical protein ACJ73_00061 [Blastomyces percursus]|uniref:Uncharacterized protein n=1 Tax=Blastomyces percursus TaxID=1658174 RepID=A0A1J9QI59_9EURO|nr:hypothetical protein ACJ73_00061 [Blastomyces percursus]